MQRAQTRDFRSIETGGRYTWRSDEEALVNSLMGLAWNQHASRWTRFKFGVLGIVGVLSLWRLLGR